MRWQYDTRPEWDTRPPAAMAMGPLGELEPAVRAAVELMQFASRAAAGAPVSEGEVAEAAREGGARLGAMSPHTGAAGDTAARVAAMMSSDSPERELLGRWLRRLKNIHRDWQLHGHNVSRHSVWAVMMLFFGFRYMFFWEYAAVDLVVAYCLDALAPAFSRFTERSLGDRPVLVHVNKVVAYFSNDPMLPMLFLFVVTNTIDMWARSAAYAVVGKAIIPHVGYLTMLSMLLEGLQSWLGRQRLLQFLRASSDGTEFNVVEVAFECLLWEVVPCNAFAALLLPEAKNAVRPAMDGGLVLGIVSTIVLCAFLLINFAPPKDTLATQDVQALIEVCGIPNARAIKGSNRVTAIAQVIALFEQWGVAGVAARLTWVVRAVFLGAFVLVNGTSQLNIVASLIDIYHRAWGSQHYDAHADDAGYSFLLGLRDQPIIPTCCHGLLVSIALARAIKASMGSRVTLDYGTWRAAFAIGLFGAIAPGLLNLIWRGIVAVFGTIFSVARYIVTSLWSIYEFLLSILCCMMLYIGMLRVCGLVLRDCCGVRLEWLNRHTLWVDSVWNQFAAKLGWQQDSES